MVRASAKNFIRVASVTNPRDYRKIVSEMKKTGGCLSLATRFMLSRKAFTHTASYDKAIAGYLKKTEFETVRNCYKIGSQTCTKSA